MNITNAKGATKKPLPVAEIFTDLQKRFYFYILIFQYD